MDESTRSELIKELGLEREEANWLLDEYEKTHDGKVNVPQIIEDVNNIISGRNDILSDTALSESEKKQLGDLFITYSLRNGRDDYFSGLAQAIISDRFNVLMKYLNTASNLKWYEKRQLVTEMVLPDSQRLVQDSYNELIDTLNEMEKTDEIVPIQVLTSINQSPLSRNGKNNMRIWQDEETNRINLRVRIPNPAMPWKPLDIKLDGAELNEIIDRANQRAFTDSKRQLEKFAQSGIGEISVSGGRNGRYVWT